MTKGMARVLIISIAVILTSIALVIGMIYLMQVFFFALAIAFAVVLVKGIRSGMHRRREHRTEH